MSYPNYPQRGGGDWNPHHQPPPTHTGITFHNNNLPPFNNHQWHPQNVQQQLYILPPGANIVQPQQPQLRMGAPSVQATPSNVYKTQAAAAVIKQQQQPKSAMIDLKTPDVLSNPGQPSQRAQDMRSRLNQLINDPNAMDRAARLAFSNHDVNRDEMLQKHETDNLIKALTTRYDVPEPERGITDFLFSKYDVNCRGEIPTIIFPEMYKSLLYYIRERYYPDKLRFRRGSFIQKKDIPMHSYWKTEEKIGQGQFGIVYKVSEICRTPDRRGQLRCCKVISKERLTCPPEYIANEIQVLRKLDHPNIMRMIEAYEDYQNIYLIFELIEGKELLDVIMDLAKSNERLTEDRVRRILHGILSALSHCHSYRVMHKDLKPENIMICCNPGRSNEEEFVKIIDFGLAEVFTPGAASTIVAGTPYYMSPEVFSQRFNYKCDVWSVGVLMYLMLTAHLPFDAPNKEAFVEVVKRKDVSFPSNLFGTVSQSAQDLIRKLLEKNVNKRPSASEALHHPFFEEETPVPGQMPVMSQRRRKTLQSFSKQGSIYQLYAERDCFARIVLNLAAMNVDYLSIKEAPDVFKSLDRNNDGTISEEEMTKGLEEINCPKEV
eukprot:TRINITY_DN56262_c0_g1_i3.p1 TRINITY_DN56262_c0_g1~~TRINITY_DN56262_c0_g1_i3.p1  ORF type:complete len:604 (+),score=95.32 TRINITY_DN56262_c0_g1_i3:106-1917(+)